MSFYKDLWIAEYDRIYTEGLDRGLPDGVAERIASRDAQSSATDRLADLADRAKDLWKERDL
jgi:hypothetical protein